MVIVFPAVELSWGMNTVVESASVALPCNVKHCVSWAMSESCCRVWLPTNCAVSIIALAFHFIVKNACEPARHNFSTVVLMLCIGAAHYD